jgi:hypothetical protein
MPFRFQSDRTGNWRLTWGAFTAIAAAACAPSETPPSQTPGIDWMVVPASHALILDLPVRGPPVVAARVDGADARLLVDTGGQFTWLDRDFVRRHALLTEPVDVGLTDAHGNEARVRESMQIRLELAGTELCGLRPLVLDSIHEGVDGALGQDCLRPFTVIFDGPGRRLLLLPGGERLRDQVGLLERTGRAHEHAVDWSSGIPKIEVAVPDLGSELAFVIDTGAQHNALPESAITALGLRRVGTFAGVGLAGPGPRVGLYEVEELRLGDFKISGLLTELPHAALGWETLACCVLVFENASERLLLLPDAVVSSSWPAPLLPD